MNQTEIFTRLKTMIVDRFELQDASITGETRQKELGIDSILMVDLMLDVESELDFTFESMDLPTNPSLNEIVALISQNMAGSDEGLQAV